MFHALSRRAFAAVLLSWPIALAATAARAQAEQQALVDRATLTVNELLGGQHGEDSRRVLRRSRAVLIFPRVFRGGFIIGGEGGSGVLVARDAGGSWSAPAFYGLGGASLGLQIGIQDAQVIIFIMSDRALRAVLQSQFKFGADASLAVATIGAGIAGGTTAALNADFVSMSRARGLYAGISLEGSILARRNEDNEAYYGRPVSAEQIVVTMEVHNPGADNLRAALIRWSTE
ncbi:MAG: lipid-binding SYLF domain-containing protein [Acetobacteraceae bacterium]|nr:lipid-binding SYLF domain-containing protein [Acetobacteraceae bacterium]